MQTKFSEFTNRKHQKLWQFSVIESDKVVFRSEQLAIRLKSKQAAMWLSNMVINALQQDKFPSNIRSDVGWSSNAADDWHFQENSISAHIEHLYVAKQGGVWFCKVADEEGGLYFSTADRSDIEIKSCHAAKQLCHLLIINHVDHSK